jgi:hypothetical protein
MYQLEEASEISWIAIEPRKEPLMGKPKKNKKSVPARDLAAKRNVKGGGSPANRPRTPITNLSSPVK